MTLSQMTTSVHWIITLGGNLGVLSQAASDAKNSPPA